jgi:S-formylglutathione hydrolase FrmB
MALAACKRHDHAVVAGDDAGGVSRRALLLGGLGVVVAAGVGGLAYEWDSPAVMRVLGRCGDTPDLPPSSYRVTTSTFSSEAMKATVPWLVAVPDDYQQDRESLPLVLCLHGAFSDADRVVSAVGFPAYASAVDHRFALAAPGGGGALYWHPRADGRDPLAWAVDEFVPFVEKRFGVGGNREQRGVIGWSMGGAGALMVAQERPDLVSAAVALSPAVWPSYDAARSGHTYTFESESDWERFGVYQRLDELHGIAVRIDCGDGDPFAPTARQLLDRIPDATGGIDDGCHDNGFWRRHAPAALRFLDDHLAG